MTKKWISLLLLAALLCSLCPFALADQLTEPLNAAVPFGIAHSEEAGGLAVYPSANARNSIDKLQDYQLCAILSTQGTGKSLWYEIRYISGNKIKEGYLKGSALYPLTVAGLIAITADAKAAEALRTLGSASNADAFVKTSAATPKPTATPKPSAAPKPTVTPSSGRKKYVLNTKTMKFHVPSCGEATRITDENRKNTTTTRESLIDQGYTPCQKCNP